LRASTDVARDKFKERLTPPKDMASGTVDQLQEQTREQQRTGADFVERFSGNIREAARAFESDAPFAAAASIPPLEYVEEAAEKIRNGSFRDLVDGATDFAKRQPDCVPRDLGARRLRGVPLPTGVRPTVFVFATPQYVGLVIFGTRRYVGRGFIGTRGDAWSQASSRPGNKLGANVIITTRQHVMSIQNDIRTSQNDLRTISTLLGDALSQFAKLFQNEVDLAKSDSARRFKKVGGAMASSREAPSW